MSTIKLIRAPSIMDLQMKNLCKLKKTFQLQPQVKNNIAPCQSNEILKLLQTIFC